jgi:hypothetical protein
VTLERRLGFGCGALAGAIPILAAATRSGSGIDAACDAGVVRVIGRGYTGAFHGLDVVGALLGVHAAWASVACASALGVVTYTLARRLLRAIVPGSLGLALAVVASALATLTFPAQRETMLVAGSVLGALLAIAPLALVSERAPAAVVAAALGLAASYDVPVACAAAAGCSAALVVRRAAPKWSAAPWAIVGVLPIAWMLWRRVAAADASLEVSTFSGAMGEGAAAGRWAALSIARGELGIVALGAAGLGVVVALRSRAAHVAAGLFAIVLAGVAATAAGAPAGPVRFGGALVAALAATSALTACGMGAVASAVAEAKVPFARASAAMIVLLEIAVPVRVADDASLATAKLGNETTSSWNARVFGDLPHGAVVLLPNAPLFLRARAAAASGALRPDVIVVATTGMSARATSHAIAREPLVAPLVRDLALYGAPEEFSLSELAGARPVLVAFDPKWDKRFARHLLPEGAFDRYFVEPRGSSERVKTLAATAIDEPTLHALAENPPLRDATRDVLRARALAADATGEREYAAAATAELRRIDPNARVHLAEQNN